MWDLNIQPTLSLPDMAKRLGISVAQLKEHLIEQDRARDAKAKQLELRAAAMRHRQGPRRVNEALGDARPEMALSRWNWLQLHRATLHERGAKGGEILNDDDFVRWALKRNEHWRIRVACAQNKTGWLPTVERAKQWGERERAGKAKLNPITGGWDE